MFELGRESEAEIGPHILLKDEIVEGLGAGFDLWGQVIQHLGENHVHIAIHLIDAVDELVLFDGALTCILFWNQCDDLLHSTQERWDCSLLVHLLEKLITSTFEAGRLHHDLICHR